MKLSMPFFVLLSGTWAFAAPSSAVKRFLGDDALRILEKAERVESFRVSSEDSIEGDGERRIGGFKVTGTGTGKLKPKELTSILFDEKTYNFESAKRCTFMPGVAFRFWQKKETVDVLVCYSCNELQVVSGAKKATEDFDRARPKLVKLAKRAFPGDKEIKELSPTP